MQLPTDKYLLQDYRDDMRTADAPQMLETQTPLLPVKNIGAGLPRPNSKQSVKWAHINVGNTGTQQQVSSVSSSKNVYILGVQGMNHAAVAMSCGIWDGTSGTGSDPGANSMLNDGSGKIFYFSLPATVGAQDNFFMQSPLKMIGGIRTSGGGPGVNASVIIYYMEEFI